MIGEVIVGFEVSGVLTVISEPSEPMRHAAAFKSLTGVPSTSLGLPIKNISGKVVILHAVLRSVEKDSVLADEMVGKTF